MLNTTEMRDGLLEYMRFPAYFLPPWVLAWLVWLKNIGEQIPFYIPVVSLYDFSDPNEIREGKDCPFAIDGERYYFTKLVRRDESGNRSKRKAGENGAYWKSTSTAIEIKNLHRKLIGYMRKYTLYDGANKKQNWLMEEYRVHDPRELVDPYVLCKIYDKESACGGQTDVSIRALTERAIERKRGSQPDQTNSKFGNMSPSTSTPKNPFQPQFDNNMPQTSPTSENFPHDASGNQILHQSIPPIHLDNILMNQSQIQFDDYFAGDPMMQPPSPMSPGSSFYISELRRKIDPSFNGSSMPPFETLNAPDGEESLYELWKH